MRLFIFDTVLQFKRSFDGGLASIIIKAAILKFSSCWQHSQMASSHSKPTSEAHFE